jgi:hypothetical protein
MLLRLAQLAMIVALCGMACAQDKAASPQAEAKPATSAADASASKVVPLGSKIYIAPMANGFETYGSAGIVKKEAPVVLVNDKS